MVKRIDAFLLIAAIQAARLFRNWPKEKKR